MNPTRILPDLQCSLLCEDIRQEANGNFILLGVTGLIRVPQVPVTAGRMLFFNRWTAGVGEFTQTLRLIAPDQSTVVGKNDMRFNLADVASHTINVSVFGNVPFTAAGVYFVEVLVDDVMKLRFPLPVVVVPPPQPPEKNPAEPQKPGPA